MIKSTTDKIVYLEKAVNLFDLQKTYNDSVEFITDTENFPMVTAIGYSGKLNKAIKAKLTPKGIKQKVDVLIQHYGDKLKRKWFVAKEDLINQLTSVEKMAKGGPGSGRHPEGKSNIDLDALKQRINFVADNPHKVTREEYARAVMNWHNADPESPVNAVNIFGDKAKPMVEGDWHWNHLLAEHDSRTKDVAKGGPGSGCTVESGNCGRPSTGSKSLEKLKTNIKNDLGDGVFADSGKGLARAILLPDGTALDATHHMHDDLLGYAGISRQEALREHGWVRKIASSGYELVDRNDAINSVENDLINNEDEYYSRSTVALDIYSQEKIKGSKSYVIPFKDIKENNFKLKPLLNKTYEISSQQPYTEKFEKGGPGSGCVGENCGRPTIGIGQYHQWEEPKLDIKLQEARPAVRYKGKVFVGNKGVYHQDIADKHAKELSTESSKTTGRPFFDWANIEQGFVAHKDSKEFIPRQKFEANTGIYLSEDLRDEQNRTVGGLPKEDFDKFEKADEETDEDKEKKKQIIETILAGLAVSLGDTALDVYKDAYMLGKERGVSISGEDFKRTISEEDEKKLLGLVDENQQYLDNFMQDLKDRYSEAIDTEYASKQAEEQALARIMTGAESRLGQYALAALGALGIGFTAGLGEANEEAPEGEEEVSGIIWVTQHDDLVCPGCEDNDGKFFTFDEFEDEYQNNECLTRCRCAESSEPTTAPAEHFGKSLRYTALEKGGPGSGRHPEGRTKPNFNIMQNQNRRFMYHPDTNSAILSRKPFNTVSFSTHAEMHRDAKTGIPYDDYIKGWVGRNTTSYPNGVVHFAPALADDYMQDTKGYDNVANTAQYFIAHGANKDTVLRNFKGVGEQKLGDAFPELFSEKVEKGGPGSGCNPAVATCGRPTTTARHDQEGFLALRPALKYKGEVYSGKRADLHSDVYDKWLRVAHNDKNLYETPNLNTTNGIQTGFVDKNGKFLTREKTKEKYDVQESIDLANQQHEIDGQYPYEYGDIRHPGLFKGGEGSGCVGVNCGRPKKELNITELRPALRFNGQSSDIKIGNKGETHGDIYNRLSDEEMDMNPEGGFVDKDGNWMNREQLQNYVNENRSRLHTSVYGASSEDLRTVQHQLEYAQKFEKFIDLKKGGEGSGSWEAPGEPRFAWTPSKDSLAVLDNTEPQRLLAKPVNPGGKTSKELHMHENGEWSEERKVLHNKIKEDFFKGKTPVEKPVAYLMGGGTASGKSSLLASGKLEIPENTVKVDSDDIKAKLPEYQKMLLAGNYNGAAFTHNESSDISRNILKDATEGNYNVLLDGTGDSDLNKLEDKINIMRSNGATVEANYTTIDVEDAVARNLERAKKTGRYVPEPVIRKMYSSISTVVPQAIERGFYDKFTLWDNTASPVKIATAEGKNLKVLDQEKWNKFISAKDTK